MVVGQTVWVTRKRHGVPPEVVSGVIERFSSITTIHGEQTAYIKYTDGKGGGHFHPISDIKTMRV